MNKRIIALMLVLSLLFTSTRIVFANSIDVGIEGEYQKIALSDEITSVIRESSDGQVEIMIYSGNTLSSSALLDRPTGLITTKIYSPESIISSYVNTSTFEPVVGIITPNLPSIVRGTVTKRGRINYEYYIQGVASSRRLNISYKSDTDTSSQYNLNGTYQTLATLAAVLVQLLALDPSVAVTVAGAIFAEFSYPLDAISAIIPDYYVRATKYTMTWYAKYSSTTGHFSGDKYVVNLDGSNRTYYDGPYYTVSNFTSTYLNSSLADYIFNCINLYWGDGQYTVLDWDMNTNWT